MIPMVQNEVETREITRTGVLVGGKQEMSVRRSNET